MPEYRGIGYLRRKLNEKKLRVDVRKHYYEMKEMSVSESKVIPAGLLDMYRSTLGWCAKAVDSIADRLVFKGFAEDYFEINDIFLMNNSDIMYDSAILSAVMTSCSFVYVSPDSDGFPRLQVIDGGNATGIIDPLTSMLDEGYAVLKRDDYGNPLTEAYFTKEYTEIHKKGVGVMRRDRNPAPYALLVPIVYRPDDRRPFGHSRISRACMYLQKFAKRTLERSEVAAEFYAFPQKYALGLEKDHEQLDKWMATISSFLQFDQDDNGNHPVLGQFQQASMSPYSEQLKTAASIFAGETGLTVDDLGFAKDNPASSEAIKASHEGLRLIARKAQRTFGSGFLNVGYLAACVRDDYAYQRRQFYLSKPKWAPIFEPDASALTVLGDGVSKINTAVPGYLGADNLEELTGIEPSEDVNNGEGYSTGADEGSTD